MNTLIRILITSLITSIGLNTAQAQVKFTNRIGGSNGNKFMIPSSRQDVLSTKQIIGMAIQHSRRIEQIVVEYSDDQNIRQIESVGNDTGEWSYIDLEEGEYIIYITGRAGTLIDQLTFYTSMRRTFGPYGGSGGEDFEISIPSDAKVIGFTGNVGPSINQIGLIYKRPNKSNQISKNMYRGTVGPNTTKNTYLTAQKFSTKDVKRRTVRDQRTKNAGFTIRDSIGVMGFVTPDKIGVNNPVVGMNGRGNQEPIAKASTTTNSRIRDHRTNNSDSKYHPDSIGMFISTPFINKKIKPSVIEMNGRGTKGPEAKRTNSNSKRRVRDHRKNN